MVLSAAMEELRNTERTFGMDCFAEAAQAWNCLWSECCNESVATQATRMHGHAFSYDNACATAADPRDVSDHGIAHGRFLPEIADCRQPHDAVLGDFRPHRKW